MTHLVSCLVLVLALLVCGCGSDATPETDATTAPFGDTMVIAALTDAMIIGTERAVARLQQVDGYWSDPDLRIPLPDDVKSVESIIRENGNGQHIDDLHLAMNHAAEGAVGEIEVFLMPEIARLKWQNPGRILHGKDNAASVYLRQMTAGRLEPELRPVIESFLSNAPGYVDGESASSQTRMRDVAVKDPLHTDLIAHTTDWALQGFFLALGEEEHAIRTQPEKRTTNALQEVFAQ